MPAKQNKQQPKKAVPKNIFLALEEEEEASSTLEQDEAASPVSLQQIQQDSSLKHSGDKQEVNIVLPVGDDGINQEIEHNARNELFPEACKEVELKESALVQNNEEDNWETDTTTKKKNKTQARKQRQVARGGPILEQFEEKVAIVLDKTRPYHDTRQEPLGYTSLHTAVLRRDTEAVTMVLKQSPDLINQLNMLGDTPLDLCGEIYTKEHDRDFETKINSCPDIAKLLVDAGGVRNEKCDNSQHLFDLLHEHVHEAIAVIVAAYSARIVHPVFANPFALWTSFEAHDPRRPLHANSNLYKQQWRSRIQFMTPHSVLQQVSVATTVYNDCCLYRRGTWSFEQVDAKESDTNAQEIFDVKIVWLTEWWKGRRKPSYSSYYKEGEFESIDDIAKMNRVQMIRLCCEPRVVPLPEKFYDFDLRLLPHSEYLLTATTKEPVYAWARLAPFVTSLPVSCIYGDLDAIGINDPQPGWCLAPWTLIKMADGTLKRADEVQVGDQVATENERSTMIECVVVMTGLGRCTKSLVSLDNNVLITAGHPVKLAKSYCEDRKLCEGTWYRPHEIAPRVSCAPTKLFNFVTSSRGSILLKGDSSAEWIASTLGQFCDGVDNPQSFYGSEQVVETLRENVAWPFVHFDNQW